jgi:hypothetical protein
MLSAILLAHPSRASGAALSAARQREAVLRSLASLVDGCVQGLIGDAVLAGAAEDAGLASIADEAGCELVTAQASADALALAAALARREGVLLLTAGYAVERGFFEEIRDALNFGDPAQAYVLRAAPRSLLTRFAPRLAAPAALVARKAALTPGAGDVPALARGLRASELFSRARQVI